MAKLYDWWPDVAAAIAGLPAHALGLPVGNAAFWSLVESQGDGALALEVLAYLVRVAYAYDQPAAADRIFAVIWERCHRRVALYAIRRHAGSLNAATSVEDIVVEAFRLLGARLRAATGVTFYERTLLGGLSKLVADQGRDLDKAFVQSLSVVPVDGDEVAQRDIPDEQAIDPERQTQVDEQHGELQAHVRERLAQLPVRAQQTAHLLMQWHSEAAIADALGVTTRMIRNYKAQIRTALAGLP